jgi:hypothetical protein
MRLAAPFLWQRHFVHPARRCTATSVSGASMLAPSVACVDVCERFFAARFFEMIKHLCAILVRRSAVSFHPFVFAHASLRRIHFNFDFSQFRHGARNY